MDNLYLYRSTDEGDSWRIGGTSLQDGVQADDTKKASLSSNDDEWPIFAHIYNMA